MEGQLVLAFVFLSLLFTTGNAGMVTIQLLNTCRDTIWPGLLTNRGVSAIPSGLKLEPKESYDVNVPDTWSGRIWARTGCSGNPNGSFYCDVGDCGTRYISCNRNTPEYPVSLLWFHLAPRPGTSLYKVDLRNGFNIPVTLTPFRGTCKKILFLMDIRQQCPDWLAVYTNERKIACRSPCYATKNPRYCCTGVYASPQKCPQNEYTKLVEGVSPDVVSNAFDDKHFSCNGGTSFTISFC